MRERLFLLLVIVASFLQAQVSPPGLGDVNAASWMALGLRQDLNENKTFESMTYVGYGATSDAEDYALVSKPAIIVVNQEFSNDIGKNLKLSYALSYRNQKEYEFDEITEKEYSKTQQEFRVYGKLAYINQLGRVKFTQTARQEYRRFVDSKWKNTSSPLQLRTRLKTQVAVGLDEEEQHTLTFGAEALFSTSKNNFTKKWSSFNYSESRFTLFYTFRPKNTPIALSVGYMNNLIEKNTTHSVHYASLDLVFEDPFRFFRKDKG